MKGGDRIKIYVQFGEGGNGVLKGMCAVIMFSFSSTEVILSI